MSDDDDLGNDPDPAPDMGPFEAVEDPDDVSQPGGGSDGIGRLFDSSLEGPSVDEIEGEYGLDWHWAVTLRGIARVATGGGVPPLIEIATGPGVEAGHRLGERDGETEPAAGNDGGDDGDLGAAVRTWSED